MWRCSVPSDPRGLLVPKLRAKMAERIRWNLLSSAHGTGGWFFNGVERVNGGALGVGALYILRPPQLSFASLIRSCSYAILLVASVATGGTGAAALPLSPFRYESQAQRHCPGDTVVWLDFRKGIYYSRGQRNYARGLSGSFVCRDEARRGGYRRSLLGLR